MRQLLSPKQVAASVGVSESSLKRWCDQGLIPIERTPGGHRRIRLRDAMQFIRDRGDRIVEPQVLGLPPGVQNSAADLSECVSPLTVALDSGDVQAARQIILSCYMGRARISEICDQLVTPVMHKLGHEWECGRLEVFQERRACEVVNQLLYELQTIAPSPGETAPIAIGGSPEGDQYRLATLMVSLALVEEGWQAISLGSNLPFETLANAAKKHNPRLLWLSLSSPIPADKMLAGLQMLRAALDPDAAVLLGGQALPPEVARAAPWCEVCNSLGEMQRRVRTLGRSAPGA